VNLDTKRKLYEACMTYAEQRVQNAEKALADTQDASNQETRSTAGDKHDTARAMMHIESERLGKQLGDAQQTLRNIKSVDSSSMHSSIKSGTLVHTDIGYFFLAISIGKLEFDDQSYFVVSPGSPMGQALMGHKADDTVQFNKRSIHIKAIC